MTLYAILAFSLSIVGLLLATIYTCRVARSYQKYHDERAAVSLAKAVGLWVIGFGLVLSSSASVLLELHAVAQHAEITRVGLSISRGALFATLATLILADVRPGSGKKEADETGTSSSPAD